VFRYRQPCAIARALDVVGERWTLLIVRELMLGSTTTTELLLGLPHLSKATLTNRLRTLAKAGLVSDDGGGHELTDEGWRLLPVLRELASWAWSANATTLTSEHIELDRFGWELAQRIDRRALPWRPAVIEIELTDRDDESGRRLWLSVSREAVEVLRSPPATVDVTVGVPAEVLARWWVGELTWRELSGRRDVHIDGRLRRDLHRMFLPYPFLPEPAEPDGPPVQPAPRRRRSWW
jgi:DNA-binding HxlR family transcriptional regulator